MELYALTGLVWRFTTPSSTDGRKIVKAAAERAGVSLKGSSNFRKEDWNDAAEEASIARLDTFSTLPGMRGFRACWADHGVALLYVPGVRRFYTVADVANGAADRKAEMDAASVISNIEGLFKSKPGLREQYEIATDPARAAEAAKAHLAELAKDFDSRGGGGGDDGVESSDATPRPPPRRSRRRTPTLSARSRSGASARASTRRRCGLNFPSGSISTAPPGS